MEYIGYVFTIYMYFVLATIVVVLKVMPASFLLVYLHTTWCIMQLYTYVS